ncbi:hypothetical protein [Nonlabens antarcticus]|uniref:hypothetical protein n=1 Tax=Nonlabens antarcticus TaxID=392714 RepID=UPI00189147D7|nr:hypothetical protein [Nonlabens antarcticus]
MQLCTVTETVFSNQVIQKIERPYGDIYLFESYVVSEVKEGIIFGSAEFIDTFTYLMDFYDGIKRQNHFVYICNRCHSFSVKLIEWLEFEFMSSFMVGFAIVDDRPMALKGAELEKRFVPCNFDLFEDLPSAVEWAVQTQAIAKPNF